LEINKYQEWTKSYDQEIHDWCLTLGLVGEAGEFAEKIKKKYRTTPLLPDPRALAMELGDVLWYLARLADVYGFTMTEIMQMNIDKLTDRAKRGKLQGEGDNR